jgi:CRISPR-associated protein Cas2
MSRKNVHRFVIAYDITDDRLRDKIAKLLQEYGERIQYSVFLADLNPSQRAVLTSELRRLIAPADAIAICDLGPSTPAHPHPGIQTLGRTRPITTDGTLIL